MTITANVQVVSIHPSYAEWTLVRVDGYARPADAPSWLFEDVGEAVWRAIESGMSEPGEVTVSLAR